MTLIILFYIYVFLDFQDCFSSIADLTICPVLILMIFCIHLFRYNKLEDVASCLICIHIVLHYNTTSKELDVFWLNPL